MDSHLWQVPVLGWTGAERTCSGHCLLQELLEIACDSSPEEAKAHTQHSPRHFLREAARSRDEPSPGQNEIGRWCNSVAQMAELLPEARIFRVHQSKCASVADLYAQHSLLEPPFAIPLRDMNALREMCAIGAVLTASLSGGLESGAEVQSRWGAVCAINPCVHVRCRGSLGCLCVAAVFSSVCG